MKAKDLIAPWLVCCGLMFASCGSNKDASSQAAKGPETEPNNPAAPAPRSPTDNSLAAAQESLKKGAVDEAAARLAQLQMQGATFSAQQAKDYRQALSDAYERAIEAAERGDPRAQAALQLLRAAGPR